MAKQLNENINQVMANIKQLQKIESDLYSELDVSDTPAHSKQLLDKISNVSQIRANLFKTIEYTQSFAQNEIDRNTETLKDQLKAIHVMEHNLKHMEEKQKKSTMQNVDMARNIEIVEYYGQKYHAQIKILKYIILLCIPLIGINLLLSSKIISSTVYMLLLTIIVFVGLYVVIGQIVDISYRSSTNFDKYKWSV